MTTIFKELPNGAVFKVKNADEIIRNRGDRGVSAKYYGDRYGDTPLTFTKRDESGGHIINISAYGLYGNESVYYRIEPDNVVETI